MKNFTNNFKQFTSRLSARWLIMALMMLVGTSSAWGWGFKYDDGSNWNTCSSSNFDQTTFYTNPTGSSTTSVYIRMHTGLVKTGFNITQNDDCGGQKLYVNLSGVASTSSNTIVRASARWVNNKGIYSEYTIVIPDGKIYIKPTNGDAVLMTKSTYTYTAELTLSDAMTFDLYADDPGNSTIENQDGMPSAGKPTSVRLNYTGLTSPYKYVKVSYNLKTNRITFTEMDPPCTPPDAPSLTNPDPLCGGSITLPESANEVNLKWYDAQTGGNVVSNTEITATGTYWAAAVTECESTDRTAYTVTINPIPEVNSLLSPLNICIGSIDETDLTTLSHVEVSSGSTAVWYTSKDGVEQAEGANLINGGTYWVAAENSTTGCKSTTRTSFTININDLPQPPSLGNYEYKTCAHASNTVDLDELADVNNVIWYQDKDEVQNPHTISIANEGTVTYTAKAVNVNGCQSATGVDFTLIVNPLPTITSISASNDKPVLFEDVVLTADGVTSGAEVKWYLGNDVTPVATGTTYTVTSETAGEVIVKAKAFLNGCESAVATKTVKFSKEDCADVTTTAEETVGKIKLLLSKPSWIGSGETFYCYAWENNTSNTLLGSWPGTELKQKEGSYYVIIVDSNNKNIKIILNDGSEQTVDSDVLNANKIYQISATSSKNSDNKYTFNSKTDKGTYKESVTTTTPAPITDPAVKITSLTTTPGEGNINFSGQIVKTGCDNSITYGFEYKAEGGAEWTQKVIGTNQDKDAGFDFSDNTVKDLDGTYEVRAFITNDHITQYSDVKTIELSTSREPVKSATIELTALDGTPIEPGHKYCIGSTAYIKLTTNVNYTSASWKSNQGAEIVPTRTTNIYQFTVKGNDEIVALVSNKYNITPAESNSVLVDVYPEPISPTVSLSPNVICSNNDGATLSIASVAVGQTYVLYKYADENDNEGAEVDGYDALPCIDAKDELSFTNLTQAGRYFVKTYNTDNCPSIMSASSFATLEVVDASDVFIVFEPTTATTTPWMPAKFTVNASDKYTLTVPEGVVYNIDGNKVSVKIPLPEGSTGGDEQYENVSFPQGAKTSYTIIANLATSGGVDNPCAAPAEATITLTPYVEPCTEGH